MARPFFNRAAPEGVPAEATQRILARLDDLAERQAALGELLGRRTVIDELPERLSILDELLERQAVLEDLVAHIAGQIDTVCTRDDLEPIRAELASLRAEGARSVAAVNDLRGDVARLWCSFTELYYKALFFFRKSELPPAPAEPALAVRSREIESQHS